MHRTALLILILFAACNTTSPDVPVIIGPDASPDGPPQGPNLVELTVFGSEPTLIQYRDGSGPWIEPQEVSFSHFELHVTRDYDLVVVCTDGNGGFAAERMLATVDDDPRQMLFCGVGASEPAVAVTGQMNQPGSVWMGTTATSTTAPWQFDLAVTTGVHDLVATDNSRVLIRRNRTINGPTSEPVIDLAADGTEMTSVPMTLSGTEVDDVITTQTYLLTGRSFATIFEAVGSTARTVPALLLQPNDVQLAMANASQGAFVRRAFAQLSETPPTFTLLPRLSAVTFAIGTDRASATWSTLPDYDQLEVYVGGAGSTPRQQHVTATRSWVELTGATAIEFDTTIPGYSTAWKIDPAMPYTRTFGVNTAFSGSDPSYGTAITESMNGALARHGFVRNQVIPPNRAIAVRGLVTGPR